MAKQRADDSKPKKYFDDQFDDEEVLLVFRKHPIVMRIGLILSCFGVLVGPLVTLGLMYAKPDNPPSMTFFGLSVLGGFILGGILFFPYWLGCTCACATFAFGERARRPSKENSNSHRLFSPIGSNPLEETEKRPTNVDRFSGAPARIRT